MKGGEEGERRGRGEGEGEGGRWGGRVMGWVRCNPRNWDASTLGFCYEHFSSFGALTVERFTRPQTYELSFVSYYNLLYI